MKPGRLRNRYHGHSKISEYRFLKLLKAFADEKTVQEAADATRLSTRTVRDMYQRFRESLLRAALEDPFTLGWTGYFLFERQKISVRGHAILDAIAGSNLFRSFIERHGIRTGFTKEKPESAFSYVVFETAVRIFCTLSMRKDNDTLYSDEIHEAYANLQLVALYIHMHKDGPDDPELFNAVVASFEKIMKAFQKLL